MKDLNENLASSLETLFKKMEGLVSTKTVVGDPLRVNGVTIVPLVEVSFGIGAGSGKGGTGADSGGGGAAGGKICPVGVLVVEDGSVQLVNIKNQESVNKLIDLIPGILSKFKLDKFFEKKEE